MTILIPILAFAGVTVLLRNISGLCRSAAQGSDQRLEWYLAEARSYYDRADGQR